MLRRLERVRAANQNPALIPFELEQCRRDIFYFLNWYGWTYDPRNAGTELPTRLPFDLWDKQADFIRWLDYLTGIEKDGLAEKTRDAGFTWLCGAWAWHKWRFVDGFDVAFGSRKQELVDKLGDPKTIFEKIRYFMRGLPRWMLPVGFDSVRHDNFLRLINPANGNSIVGEGGDQMGRGARVKAYIIDEAAFLERADRVEAATSASASFRVWGSSVNGVGNLFHRKRTGGTLPPEQVFIFDVRDDPRKDDEWIEAKQASMEPHVWASEYGRDYSASVEGICIPGKWVDAAFEIAAVLAEKGIKVEPTLDGIAGLDVGGGGKAKSVAVARFGPFVTPPEAWGDPDTNETAARALDYAQAQKPTRHDGKTCVVKLANYDSVGVGVGCLGIMQRGRPGLTGAGVNTGLPANEDRTWPSGETSKERFGNLKAELWFLARERLKNTYELLLWLKGKPGGQQHSVDEITIFPPRSLSPEIAILAGQLSSVKWGRNEVGKTVIESKKALATRGIPSPDHAEAYVLTFVENNSVAQLLKAFGG